MNKRINERKGRPFSGLRDSLPSRARRALGARVLLFPMLLSLFGAAPAQAQRIILSSEADYILLDQEWRDPNQHVTTSRFLPQLNLSLTGPLRPGMHVYLDVIGGMSQDIGNTDRQSANNVRLTLRGETPHFYFSLLHGKSHFASSSDVLGLGPLAFSSNNTDTALTLSLREPAWPLINVQYERFASAASGSGLSSTSNSASSRLSGIYDVRPFRFQFDTNRYTTTTPGLPDSGATSRRVGMNFNTALLPGLTLNADVQYDRRESSVGSLSLSGFSDRVARVRATALPTPKVALDAEVRSQVGNGLFDASNRDFSLQGSTLNLRSEVLPGLQFNLSRDTDHLTRAGLPVTNTTTRADLFTQLNDRNSVTFSFSPNRIVTGSETTQQQANRVSWNSQLDSRTDLTVSFDRFTDDDSRSGETRTTTHYASVRYRPDLQTSMGLALLSGTTDTAGADSQSVKVLSGDFSWLPTSTLSLGLRLDLTRLSGASSARISVPSFDLRWQPDSRTNVALNWRKQNAVERALDTLSNVDASAVWARFEHQLSRNSSLTVEYRLLTASEGPLASERVLRVGVTSNLGK